MTAAEATSVQEEQAPKKMDQQEDAAGKPPVTDETPEGKLEEAKAGDSKADEAETEKNKTEESKPDESQSKKTEPEEDKAEEKSNEANTEEKDTTKKDETKLEPIKEDEDPAVEATMYLVQGKRHILVQDFVSAVEALEKACELLSAKYGDGASECAEALLYYGKALLELHRKQSGALNDMDNAEAEEEDSSDEEEEEEPEETDEAKQGEDSNSSEDAENKEKSEKESADTKSEEQAAKDEEDLEKPDPALIDSKLDAPEGQSSGQGAVEGEEDASSDLQIAFEVLDLAKSIFKRDAEKNPELYLKAADCLLSLGEVGLESDNYTQAIEDFESCLRIQQEMLPGDSREIAETNYQLGLTHSFVNQYEQSAAYFADAIQILKLKMDSLRKSIEDIKAKGEARGSLDDDPVWRAEREIEEIEGLLPEILSKLEDSKEMQRNGSSKNSEIVQEMFNRTPETSPVKKSNQEVNKIGASMIRRKRTQEDLPEAAAPSEKKPREEEN